MLEKDLDIIYNKEYLVIVPKMTEHLLDAFQYSFGNVILMNNSVEEISHITDFIHKNNFKQIILVDYQIEYEEVINSLLRQYEIKMVFTRSLGSLCDEFTTYIFNNIYRLYENGIVSKIGFLDKNFYETLKHKGDKVEYIQLDIEQSKEEETYEENRIGLLNTPGNSKHSFYNELSGIKLSNKYSAKLYNPDKTTKKFLKLFNINYTTTSKENLYKNNLVNLYVNFTDNNNLEFIKSMDYGVPCILGNNQILNKEKSLQELLVMKSDDDIDEISSRISLVANNRDKIKNEYRKFREKYSKESKESIKNFIGIDVEKEAKQEKDLLLTVVVPVYNVEKYLRNSLNSVIEASIDDMEILVINDGSTDNSEKIAKEFEKKYPKLIRYIKKENGGLGSVRNVGLREARGKYLASIDSDDTINKNFFVEAEPYLKKDIDLVICDWLSIKEDQTSFETPAIEWSLREKNIYEGLLYSSIMPSTCNKIMKKSILDSLNLEYIEDKYEDLSLNPLFMLKAKTIKYINKPYYEYYLRSGSLMRSSAGYSMIHIIKGLNDRIKSIEKEVNVDLEEFKYYTFSWRIEEFIMNQLYTIDEKEKDKFIQQIYKNIYDICVNIFESDYYKNMLDTIKDEEKRKFIMERNKMLKEKKLNLLDNYNEKYKLNAVIIYYGDEYE